MKDKKIGIYKIENLINGKFYIGSSTNIDKRFNEHKNELRNNHHVNKHLQSAWNKYGEDNFSFEILELINPEDFIDNKQLRDLETEYILDNETYKDDFGYNIIPGGIGTLNQPCSEEKKKKISESNKGKTPWNKGKAMSEDQKQLLKEINTKKRGKKIDIYDKTGNFIETLNSVKEVTEKYHVAKNTITDSCRNRRTPKNYIFKYHDIESNKDLINKEEKTFIKNKTCGESKFIILDLDGNLLYECRYKKEVNKFLNHTDARNGNLERKLSKCVENNEPVCLYNSYIVKYVNALSSGDITDASRQLDSNIEGTNNCANGES